MFSSLHEDSSVQWLAKIWLSWNWSVHAIWYMRLHGRGRYLEVPRREMGSMWFGEILAETIEISILCTGVTGLPLTMSMCIHEEDV